jgi:excisionase family DNA binding protein
MADQLLRVGRVAKLLDVSKKRVYNLIQEGKLDSINLGVRQTRIVRESLEAYIEFLRKRRKVELGFELDDPDNPFFPDDDDRRPAAATARPRRLERPGQATWLGRR